MEYFKNANFSEKLKKYQEKLKPAFQNVSQKMNTAIQELKTNLNEKINKEDGFFILPIQKCLFWMPNPKEKIKKDLKIFLDKSFDDNYHIWNFSETKTTPIDILFDKTTDFVYTGYPIPSLEDLFIACKEIVIWIQSDTKNNAFVYCTERQRGRSGIILSLVMLILDNVKNIDDGLKHFSKVTNTEFISLLLPTQKFYLPLIENALEYRFDETPKRLLKVIFSEIPKSKIYEESNFKPYFQIFSDSQIIYNSLTGQSINSYKFEENNFWFEIGNIVKGDILFRVKHFISNQTRIPVFRFMINTSMINSEVLRIKKENIDVGGAFQVSEDFFIDLILTPYENELEENSKNEGNNDSTLKHIVSELLQIKSKILESKKIEMEKFKLEKMLAAEENPELIKEDSGSTNKSQSSTSKDGNENLTKKESPKNKLYNQIMDSIDFDNDLKDEEFDDYLAKLESGN